MQEKSISIELLAIAVLLTSLLCAVLGAFYLTTSSGRRDRGRYSFAARAPVVPGKITRVTYTPPSPAQANIHLAPTILRQFQENPLFVNDEEGRDDIAADGIAQSASMSGRPAVSATVDISVNGTRISRHVTNASPKEKASDLPPSTARLRERTPSFKTEDPNAYASSNIPPASNSTTRRSPAPTTRTTRSSSRPPSPGPSRRTRSTSRGPSPGPSSSGARMDAYPNGDPYEPIPSHRSGSVPLGNRQSSPTPSASASVPRRGARTRGTSAPPVNVTAYARSFIRHHRRPDNFWFQTESQYMIDGPPDLSSRRDLMLGDIFHHRYVGGSQLWIWKYIDGVDTPVWEPIEVGYQRNDGKRIHITEIRKEPSWVTEHWCSREMRKQRGRSAAP